MFLFRGAHAQILWLRFTEISKGRLAWEMTPGPLPGRLNPALAAARFPGGGSEGPSPHQRGSLEPVGRPGKQVSRCFSVVFTAGMQVTSACRP